MKNTAALFVALCIIELISGSTLRDRLKDTRETVKQKTIAPSTAPVPPSSPQNAGVTVVSSQPQTIASVQLTLGERALASLVVDQSSGWLSLGVQMHTGALNLSLSPSADTPGLLKFSAAAPDTANFYAPLDAFGGMRMFYLHVSGAEELNDGRIGAALGRQIVYPEKSGKETASFTLVFVVFLLSLVVGVCLALAVWLCCQQSEGAGGRCCGLEKFCQPNPQRMHLFADRKSTGQTGSITIE